MNTVNAIIYSTGLAVISIIVIFIVSGLIALLWVQFSQAIHMSLLMKRAYNKYPDDKWTDEYRKSKFKFLIALWFYGFTQFLPLNGCTVNGLTYHADYTKFFPKGEVIELDDLEEEE